MKTEMIAEPVKHTGEYKQTEIGIIPQDWDMVSIQNIFDISAGGDLLGDCFSLVHDSKYCYPVFSNAISKNGLYGFSSTCRYKKKSITVTARGEIGYAVPRFQDFDAIGRVLVLKPKLEIDLIYIAECINNLIGFANESTGVPQLTAPQIAKYLIPLPPLSEQTAIAEALSDADAMIASLEKLIEKKKKIKQGAMQELLSSTGSDGKPKEGWVSYLIEDICQVLKGNGLSKEVLKEGRINNCILYGELFTSYNEIIRTTISSTDCHTSVSSKAGDILFPGSTTTSGIDLVKSSALLVDGVLLGGDIIVLRQRNTNYNSVFLSYYLNIAKRFEIAQKTSGTTIHHLYGKDLKDIVVELPNIETQNQIAKSLEDIQAEIDILERKRSKAVLFKQGMMQNLLTGKIRLV